MGSLHPLTKRELDILEYLPTRLSIEEIGARLHISPNTVKTHLRSIYRKLGACTRNEAILAAVTHHLLAQDAVKLIQG